MARWIGGDVKPNGNDRFTKVLLHLDGNVNDDNAGGSAHTWSTVGVVDLAATPKFGTAAMAVANLGGAAARCVTTPAHSDFNLGSQDFTIDFWVKTLVTTIGAPACGQRTSVGVNPYPWSVAVIASGAIGSPPSTSIQFQATFQFNLSDVFTVTSAAETTNVTGFHHSAVVRHGNTVTAYCNGVAGTPVSYSGTLMTGTGNLSVGRSGDYAGANGLNCAIDEFRLSVGIARWTSNFTPPTRAYTRFLGSSS